MKYEVIVIGSYDVTGVDEKDAKEQALHHYHNALNRWANGKDGAAQIFDIRITKACEDSKDNRVYVEGDELK